MFHVKHFPCKIQPEQQEKLHAYANLLQNYNQRLNLLSRRTTSEGLTGHIQECLALVRPEFLPGVSLVDWGTGGGLPAIPLAIVLPDVNVHAVDSSRKKILAVNAFKRELNLPNLHPWHGRAEDFSCKIQYSVSRATASLRTLWGWHTRATTPGGILYCLKGGDLKDEQKDLVTSCPKVQIKLLSLQGTSRAVIQVGSAPLPAGTELSVPASPTEPAAQ